MLVAVLQPPRMDATAMETIFEAAWAITNLAVVSEAVPLWLALSCLHRFIIVDVAALAVSAVAHTRIGG